jgi:hypothetical protein
MPSINVQQLLDDMGKAALGAVGANWPAMRDAASDELSKLATVAAQIEIDKQKGDITQDEAQTLVKMSENTLSTIWLGIQGMAKLTAEAAVNAVIGVVKAAINTATGFKLL